MPLDRRDLRRRLFALASNQAGYFTAAQAKTVGYSYPAQAHHVTAGNWVRIDHGLLRLTEWIPGEHDDLARWTLWSKQRGVVSYETALGVYGVGEFTSPAINLTVPRGFRMQDEAVRLHFVDLDDEDIEEQAGFRTTTLARSLIDVASLQPDEEQLANALTDALALGTTTKRSLRAKAEATDPLAALRIERALTRLESA